MTQAQYWYLLGSVWLVALGVAPDDFSRAICGGMIAFCIVKHVMAED